MALAKDRTPHDSHMGLIQASVLSDQASDLFLSQDLYLTDDQEPRKSLEKSGGLFKNFSMNNSSSNSNNGYENFMHISGSLLSFDQNCYDHDYSIWEDNLSHKAHNYQNQLNTNSRFLGDFNCIQTTTSYSNSIVKENQDGGEEAIDDFGSKEASFNKRPHTGESMQAFKKHCTSATRKPKPNSTPSKDPQSLAAKNRRERISERLKVLQDLVPNGSKVDMVTMLEKAISYVKFLQLQVKVLATDEFWPVQGGKAPELSQVKEAIGAILSSQRDTNSSST